MLDYDTWTDQAAFDRKGDKIGKITDVFYDDVTGRPEWVAVKAGLFKGSRLVPLAGAHIDTIHKADDDDEQRLVLAYDQDMVKDAPDMDTDDDHLTASQEQELYSFYGFDWGDTATTDFGYGSAWEQRRFDVEYQPMSTERSRTAHANRLRRYAEQVRRDRS